MSDVGVAMAATCETHAGSGRVVIRREGDRIVLDGCAEHCCVLTLHAPMMIRALDDSLGGRWG